MGQFKVGVIGAGNISSIYLKNLGQYPQTEVVALADLDLAKARAKADEHGVKDVVSVEELLLREDVQGVVNLTVPNAHFDVAMRVLASGKHVYNEKPLTMTSKEADSLLSAAKQKGLYVGCAPDTVLGAGVQTARALIDGGQIGRPLHAQAWMMGGGVEKWHPNPEFYYKPGGGPVFDMGPYYLTALVTLLGPVKTVAAMHAVGIPERLIESQPLAGETIKVETPTHFSLVLGFESGPIAQFTASFETFGGPDYPCIDIFGTEGIVRVPDPNNFGGPVMVRKPDSDWEEVAVTRPYEENNRGLGMLDLLLAHDHKRDARASGDLAAHLVEVMSGAITSGTEGKFVEIERRIKRPAAMPDTELVD